MTCCPSEYVPQDLRSVILYAGLCKRGLPPVAGGALEQTRWAMQAFTQYWSDHEEFSHQ